MPKNFVIRKIAFLELFVSNYLLGPIEVNLKLAQKFSEFLLQPNNLFPEVFYPLYYEKS